MAVGRIVMMSVMECQNAKSNEDNSCESSLNQAIKYLDIDRYRFGNSYSVGVCNVADKGNY